MPEKSFLIHDDIMPSFMKTLHNIHESCQGSFVLDNIFTPRRKVFNTGASWNERASSLCRFLSSGLDLLWHRKRIDRVNINGTCEDRSRMAHVL
ncbi:hypothetical protein AVEN_69637-1 [Araneus ventricosus]|uniref:Uncharacterized protein n=1 Tax=Araneus ventricosus TaxID=182803 RepID=A0A4Y2EXW2_ARAVE|nr:hypothetical protein AVEN_69637-1 [Araneus ventricosus]